MREGADHDHGDIGIPFMILFICAIIAFIIYEGITHPLSMEILWGIVLGIVVLLSIIGGIYWGLQRFKIIPTMAEWSQALKERKEARRVEDLERRRVAAGNIDVEAITVPEEMHLRK